jgi:hypothetical protein
VVAVDFSTASDAVVQKALAMISTKGRLTLVHVVQGTSRERFSVIRLTTEFPSIRA